MILPAVLAGLISVGLVARDALRRPGDGFTLARIFVGGAWGLTWLTYGLNLTRFPAPDTGALVLFAVGWAGSWLLLPAPPVEAPERSPEVPGRWSRWLAIGLFSLGVIVIARDTYFVVSRIAEFGWPIGLKVHRLDRGISEGAFSLPGYETMRAIVQVSGVLGSARWIISRKGFDLGLAVLGLLAVFFSTGRWEVVNYAVWVFLVWAVLQPHPSRYRWYVRQAVFVVVVGVFFVLHGEMFGKNEHAAGLAALPVQERIAAAGPVTRSEVTSPAPAAAPVPAVTPAPAPAPDASPRVAAPEARGRCERWIAGLDGANERFRVFPSAVLALLLYITGPPAVLDRALCEGPTEIRQVIFYWPFKIARLVGLRSPETTLAVDPFVDVGVPFNNYSVIYPFVNEIGPWLGPLAWIGLALGLRWFSRTCSRQAHTDWIVAAVAPMSMAIRTPWTNTYFDGTLLIWIAVAAASYWASDRDARRARVGPA